MVSALNGPALESQLTILDAAAAAGVRRFYPSEYGMHHIYRKPNDPQGYLHPLWDMKDRINDECLKHPAIEDGRVSYTLIGCGDFYNQDREKVWCPWTQTDVEKYTLHVIGDPDAEAEYTHLLDFANYLVATICEAEQSENKCLNFPSDRISNTEIKRLLERYSGKEVEMDVVYPKKMHEVIADPKQAPKEHTESAFPVDFWYMVKGMQGMGRFYRPKGQNHNDLFPDVERTTFEKYFQEKFGKQS